MASSADESFARALAALQAGQLDDAERSFKKTLRLQPRHVPALNLITIVLTQLKRYEEAEQYIKRAVQENATSDASFYNYGIILKALRRHEEAIEQFNRGLALNASAPDALNARGDCLLEIGRFKDALNDFDKALAIDPRFVDALVNKARALELDDAKKAVATIEQALALQPNHALAWLSRGNILNRLKGYDDALASFAQALAIQPNLGEAWLGRGDALAERRQFQQAIEAYERAVALEPGSSSAHSALGWMLMEMGRIEEANVTFRKSLQLNPKGGSGLYLNIASTKKFKAGDPDIAAMEALAAVPKTLGKQDRMYLDFALGKAYADVGEHHRSFQHLLAGNAAERSMTNYDETETVLQFDRLERTFTTDLIADKAGSGAPSPRPIFIVGMPRSGSTLVEQILSSHPEIDGVGEIGAFSEATVDATSRSQNPVIRNEPFPEFVPALDGPMLRAIGDNYLARIDALAGPARPRIVDKMLANFLNCGLIHLTLPNAIILHTARNPLDICISCFSIKFRDKVDYTYDLAELGRYYKRYERLMAHWHSVLPPGRILDVQYEDVVADLEGQARRIVAHCGLPWDDRCLEFHKNERAVRTASVAQVRQPIYKSSVSRWRAYEEFLEPLLKELGIDPKQAS